MKRHDEIINSLKAAITDKAHIDLNSTHVRISYDPEEKSVTIEGFVDHISKKKRALKAAMESDGIAGVIDRLKVSPSNPMSDAQIKDHLKRAFSRESTLARLELKTEITDSTVDIEGTVPSLTHKRLAGVMAWWVPGVTEVINSVEVHPPEEDDDDEVADALRLVLEKDPLVDASSITVSVNDYTITLTGAVAAQSEKDAAERDAWYVWGVNEVTNNIAVK